MTSHLTEPDPSAPPMSPWAAIIVNPAKAGSGLPEVQRLVAAATERAGWAPPTLWRTTPDDSGVGQATEAVKAGAAIVVAAGGDGTTRAVAGVLAGTGIPMGLLPMGTGNLLARNLGIPLNDLDAAVRVALDGPTREIDVSRVRIHRPDGSVDDETSVVMLGMGFDAEVVGETDDGLKKRFGWVAYVAAGLQRLWGRPDPVRLWLDDRPPVIARVRSVMVANAGTLTGGVTILPEALLDDGLNEVVTVTPRGIAGWPSIIWWAIRGAHRPHRMVRRTPVTRVRIDTRWPLSTQLDGDAVGTAIRLDVTVEARSLLVKVPESA